jgi:hypothetical protein
MRLPVNVLDYNSTRHSLLVMPRHTLQCVTFFDWHQNFPASCPGTCFFTTDIYIRDGQPLLKTSYRSIAITTATFHITLFSSDVPTLLDTIHGSGSQLRVQMRISLEPWRGITIM